MHGGLTVTPRLFVLPSASSSHPCTTAMAVPAAGATADVVVANCSTPARLGAAIAPALLFPLRRLQV